MNQDAVIAPPGPSKYFLKRALRPFSLSVALVTCGLGIALAAKTGDGNTFRATLVMMAGILLQSAVNFFNDYADLSFWKGRTDKYAQTITGLIKRNTRIAVIITAIAVVMGMILVNQSGWQLLVLGVIGIAGGYFYTGAPVNYKNRGLGVLGVFLFTGILMVAGAYVAVAGRWSWEVCLYSIPVSMISSMLLLANELRDVDEDIKNHIATFTARVGFDLGKSTYIGLGFLVILVTFMMIFTGVLESPFWLLPSLLAFRSPVVMLLRTSSRGHRRWLSRLPPLTGRFFVVYGVGFMLAL
ncbi:prenyltransferase [Sansalvadorimonas sp. 2012CJ34-2]|uniref:Prenyltransferase n=1 Tax=Parendozoicomonas callyspongiae TaxID=2942213 RepID=A0ABT0PID6_9GAMM|nr:prenyltransferase [Sansalvadorimonas sp. 2012CJ34-2]MCL6271137.1 prenyltransferase [Sansalvadorimonas sp. 2012CJ34-2]